MQHVEHVELIREPREKYPCTEEQKSSVKLLTNMFREFRNFVLPYSILRIDINDISPDVR